MIGGNIISKPDQFKAASNANHHITVHTYTHPYMTTLNNTDVVLQVSFFFFGPTRFWAFLTNSI